MKNFLTYDYCQVFPGPKLNVVLGPNGTGKSTVTHAICLACGGEPKVLGRSNELSQFVKHGKQGEEAYAEVDVLDEKCVHTIRRTINSEKNSSKWTINGTNATKDQVKVILKKLKIDVDNLCSFMSQDKVGQFTQQTPEGILKMTLQCITVKDTERTLFDEQTELAGIETTKRDQERDLNAKQATFDKKRAELTRLEVEVVNVRQRQVKKELLKKYEVKKVVQQAKADRDQLNARKEEWDKAESDRADEEKKIAPLASEEGSAKLKLSQHDANSRNLTKTFADSDSKAGSMKETISNAFVTTENIINDLASLEETRKSNERKISDARGTVKKLEDERDKAVTSIPEVNAKIKAMTDDIRQDNDRARVLEDEDNDNQNIARQMADEKQAIQSRIHHLQGSSGKFQSKLKALAGSNSNPFYHNASRVFSFINGNKEKWKQDNKIKHDIIGPVAMLMQVDDEQCKSILEKVLPNTLLFTYITTCSEDDEFLKDQLKASNFRVNLYCILSGVTSEESKRPFNKKFLERFKEMGLQGYIGDFFQTSDVVRGFLTDRSKIPRTLWCRTSNSVSEAQMRDLCGNENINVYIHDPRSNIVTEYSITNNRMEQGKPAIISTIDLPPKPLILGKAETDDSDVQKQQLESELKAVRDKIHAHDEKGKHVKEQLKKIAGPLSRKKEEILRLRKCLELPNKCERELKNKKAELDKLLKAHGQDLAQDRRETIQTYQENFENAITIVRKIIEMGEVGMTAQLEKMVTEESRAILQQRLEEISQRVIEARRAVDSFVNNAKAKKKEFEDFKKVKEASEIRATAIVAEIGNGSHDAFKAEYAKISKDTADATTLDEINDRIEALAAEIDASVDNEGLLVHYNRLMQEVDSDKLELEQLQYAFDNAQESLISRSTEWKTRVSSISDKINRSFSEYMKKLQYEGEVDLRDHGTIDQYAMQMKVSFRNNSKLADLDGNRHSGGERAVSTIMYLMALQELTSAPFRVVDEINQGMDERNERLVFDRIVDSCCGDEKNPQYFLVSPKLLQGLRRMENKDVTVLLILNGPGVPPVLPCIERVIDHVKDTAKRRRLA